MANDFLTDPNCIAWYRLENGALLIDSKGTLNGSNNGTIVGSITQGVPGVEGTAYAFAAAGYINTPVTTMKSFDIDFYYNSTATSTYSTGFNMSSGYGLISAEVNGFSYDWSLNQIGGKIVFTIGDTTFPDTSIATAGNYNDGLWHHIRITRNGTTGFCQLYVDEILIGSATPPSNPTHDLTGATSLTIGAVRTNEASTRFIGSLDNININTNGTLVNYKLNELSGIVVIDSYGNNNLTQVGSVTANTVDYDEGLASAQFAAGTNYLTRSNATLSTDFPGRNGNLNEVFSVHCRFKYTAWQGGGSSNALLGVYTATGNQMTWLLYVPSAGGKVNFTMQSNGVEVSPALSLNHWYCFGLTFDGAGNWTSRLYDEFTSAETLMGGTHPQPFTPNAVAPFQIGSNVWSITGLIDEVVIFNDILETQEMRNICSQTYPAPPPPEPDFIYSTGRTCPLPSVRHGGPMIPVQYGDTDRVLPLAYQFLEYPFLIKWALQVVTKKKVLSPTPIEDLQTEFPCTPNGELELSPAPEGLVSMPFLPIGEVEFYSMPEGTVRCIFEGSL